MDALGSHEQLVVERLAKCAPCRPTARKAPDKAVRPQRRERSEQGSQYRDNNAGQVDDAGACELVAAPPTMGGVPARRAADEARRAATAGK